MGTFLKMTCLQEQGYLPAKSCAVVSIQPAKRHKQHSHHQDQLEAYLYKVPVVESINAKKDRPSVALTDCQWFYYLVRLSNSLLSCTVYLFTMIQVLTDYDDLQLKLLQTL